MDQNLMNASFLTGYIFNETLHKYTLTYSSEEILFLSYALTICTTVKRHNLNYLINRLLHLSYILDHRRLIQNRTSQVQRYNPEEIPCRFIGILQSIQFKL